MIRSFLLTMLCVSTMLFSGWKNSSIKDITKPYLGEYECTQAMFGRENYLDKMEFITLSLEKGDKFTLSFCEKGKPKQALEGSYRYDKEKSVIVFKDERLGGLEREFLIENGEIVINVGIGKQTLWMKFQQK